MKIKYPVKHLIVTTLLAPVMYVIYDPTMLSGTKAWDMYLLFVIFGLLFSLPTFLIYYLIYNGLNASTMNQLLKKLILNLVAILGIFITLKIIKGSMVNSLIIIYSMTLIMTSLFINLPNHKNELNAGKPLA